MSAGSKARGGWPNLSHGIPNLGLPHHSRVFCGWGNLTKKCTVLHAHNGRCSRGDNLGALDAALKRRSSTVPPTVPRTLRHHPKKKAARGPPLRHPPQNSLAGIFAVGFTPWGAGRAGSGIAGCARPGRGLGCRRGVRRCGRLLRGRLLRWRRGRRSPAEALD